MFEAPSQSMLDFLLWCSLFCYDWHSPDLQDCGNDREIEADVDSQGNILRKRGPFALLLFTELCSSSLKKFMQQTQSGLINADGGKQQLSRFLFEITDAIAFMHEQGVIHHDIKPDNILISDDLHVRITDFGISAGMEEGGAGDGTKMFLPPEAWDDEAAPGMQPYKKDAFATGVTAYLMLRESGGDASTTYHSDAWSHIAGDEEYFGQISEDQKETLLEQELSHLRGSEAMRLVSGMLRMDFQQRSSVQDVRRRLVRFLQEPEALFNRSDAEDISDNDKFVAPEVPPARIKFQPRHWLLSAAVWVLRLTPIVLLTALVVWRFIVESDDEDVQKGQDEFRRMVAATTAALVFSSFVASIVSVGLVRIKQTLALRYTLILLVMLSTFFLGMFCVNRDVQFVGAIFIVYAISQVFGMWSVHLTNEFGALQDWSNKQLAFCNVKLLENLTRFELLGLIAPTLLFQLGILYAGITVVKGLPTDLWEVIFLSAVCWLVNLPRYFAHFSLVRAMTNAVNLCQRVAYVEMLRQVLENVNSILAWSLLAVQQPFWSVTQMIARTLIHAGQFLFLCGVLTSDDDDDDEERSASGSCCQPSRHKRRRRDSNNGCIEFFSCICVCVGAAAVTTGRVLKWLSSKLSVYCSKFYISMLAYDIVLGGGNNSFLAVVDRLKSYGDGISHGVESLLFFANKSISSSNNANFCILLGCMSAQIAAAIDEQAALYGYLAGYLACSTVLEVQSSMDHWFLAVWGSQDLAICPEVRDTSLFFACLFADCLMLRLFILGAGDEHDARGAFHHQRHLPKA